MQPIVYFYRSAFRNFRIPIAAAAFLALLGGLLCANVSQAAVIINMVESSGNVVLTASGSINTTDLSFYSTTYSSVLAAGSGRVVTGSYSNVSIYTGAVAGPTNVGTGTTPIAADTGSGDPFGIWGAQGWVLVPFPAYTSGSPLSGSSTWNSATFSSLGLTMGTYTWTWGSGGNADSLTLNVGVVPEPHSLLLLGVAGIVLLFFAGRARKASRI